MQILHRTYGLNSEFPTEVAYVPPTLVQTNQNIQGKFIQTSSSLIVSGPRRLREENWLDERDRTGVNGTSTGGFIWN